MGEYFKPWRRKIGIAVLALTCLFTLGWIRSRIVKDHFTCVSVPKPSFQIMSLDNYIGVVWRENYSGGSSGIRLLQSQFEPMSLWSEERGGWRWHILGIGKIQVDNFLYAWLVHYAAIVLPLTAISAWLLLSKPRTACPTFRAEREPDTDAC